MGLESKSKCSIWEIWNRHIDAYNSFSQFKDGKEQIEIDFSNEIEKQPKLDL